MVEAERAELHGIRRKIANLVDALADGASRGSAVADKLAILAAREAVLARSVAARPSAPPMLHPNLAFA
jgi:hypothetical protein